MCVCMHLCTLSAATTAGASQWINLSSLDKYLLRGNYICIIKNCTEAAVFVFCLKNVQAIEEHHVTSISVLHSCMLRRATVLLFLFFY